MKTMYFQGYTLPFFYEKKKYIYIYTYIYIFYKNIEAEICGFLRIF